MKNMIKTLALACTMIASAQTMAYEDVQGETVTQVYFNLNGDLLFKLSNHSHTSSLNCTNNNWYSVNTDDAWLKEMMHKQLLTAKVSGAPTWIRFSSCNYYPTATIINIK